MDEFIARFADEPADLVLLLPDDPIIHYMTEEPDEEVNTEDFSEFDDQEEEDL